MEAWRISLESPLDRKLGSFALKFDDRKPLIFFVVGIFEFSRRLQEPLMNRLETFRPKGENRRTQSNVAATIPRADQTSFNNSSP